MTLDECKLKIKELYEEFLTYYEETLDSLRSINYYCDEFNKELKTDKFDEMSDMSRWLISEIKEQVFGEYTWTIDKEMNDLLQEEEDEEDEWED